MHLLSARPCASSEGSKKKKNLYTICLLRVYYKKQTTKEKKIMPYDEKWQAGRCSVYFEKEQYPWVLIEVLISELELKEIRNLQAIQVGADTPSK